MPVRIWACLECNLIDFKVSLSCAKSKASCRASTKVCTLRSRWYCSRSVYRPDEHGISILFGNDEKISVPWGSLRVDCAPSLQMGKPDREVKSGQSRTTKGHDAHFRNWAQRIHHPVDLLDNAFQFSGSVNWDNQLHGFIFAVESEEKILSR